MLGISCRWLNANQNLVNHPYQQFGDVISKSSILKWLKCYTDSSLKKSMWIFSTPDSKVLRLFHHWSYFEISYNFKSTRIFAGKTSRLVLILYACTWKLVFITLFMYLPVHQFLETVLVEIYEAFAQVVLPNDQQYNLKLEAFPLIIFTYVTSSHKSINYVSNVIE